jgi:hypothetical protein
MRAGTKLVAFGAVLAIALGVGAVVGAVAGPIDVGDSDSSAVHSDAVSDSTSLPSALQASTRDSVDGYDVTLEQHDSHDSEVTITVRDGDQIVTTEPYLGGAGYLLAVREGDLADFRMHPLDDEPTGPVRFALELPSAATYALFFDFKADGVVHTARFVLDVTEQVAGTHRGDSH